MRDIPINFHSTSIQIFTFKSTLTENFLFKNVSKVRRVEGMCGLLMINHFEASLNLFLDLWFDFSICVDFEHKEIP